MGLPVVLSGFRMDLYSDLLELKYAIHSTNCAMLDE